MSRPAASRLLCAAACAVLLVGVAAPAGARATAGDAPPVAVARAAGLPVVYDLSAGLLAGLARSEVPPPGANVECTPSAAHPEPVLLLHGTLENQHGNWAALAPLLANEGYCVFTANYGAPVFSPLKGLGGMEASAAELARIVDDVLDRTGADRLDIVGHSQGGVVPRWYIRFLGGDRTVDQLIALAPSNHGTSLEGTRRQVQSIPGGELVLELGCRACTDQEVGSAFLEALNRGGDVPEGDLVAYTVIASRHDGVVVPVESAFLDGADNILLQDVCPGSRTDHAELPYDPDALRLVLNALDPAHAVAPACARP